MRKIRLCLKLILACILLLGQCVYASSQPPKVADVASTITFKENDKIEVLSEVLDIKMHGAQAELVATYKLQNVTDEDVTSYAMFLAPNTKESLVKVKLRGRETPFVVTNYILNYDSTIERQDWKYTIFTKGDTTGVSEKQRVDAVSFEMNFVPHEAYEVVVFYRYNLGGYPEGRRNQKTGELNYYLIPASVWKNFADLTINLYLDDEMPIIKSSNVHFKRVKKHTYQYVSDKMPKDNLEIVLDERLYQNIRGTLRTPVLSTNLFILIPFILLMFALSSLVNWCENKFKKQTRDEGRWE
ncbi:hypothetical protein [Cellulosilyticum ruminicola]|uniref:hypothetical protein n=1 Tax=Cellulosilyticum ruminicola TaxID=425254 RepID=UPI0006D123B4|nr:hypothetical protein [Cellulosilyticum ruminicola]